MSAREQSLKLLRKLHHFVLSWLDSASISQTASRGRQELSEICGAYMLLMLQ